MNTFLMLPGLIVLGLMLFLVHQLNYDAEKRFFRWLQWIIFAAMLGIVFAAVRVNLR